MLFYSRNFIFLLFLNYFSFFLNKNVILEKNFIFDKNFY